MRLLLDPQECAFYQRVGKAYREGLLELRNKDISAFLCSFLNDFVIID